MIPAPRDQRHLRGRVAVSGSSVRGCRILAEERHATSPSRARARCAGSSVQTCAPARLALKRPRQKGGSPPALAPLTSAAARQCQDGETGAHDPRRARSAVSPDARVFGSGSTSAQFQHWSPVEGCDPRSQRYLGDWGRPSFDALASPQSLARSPLEGLPLAQ
jgi:hypothetical protein